MATGTLTRHGSEAGYRAELQTDSVCARCRKGHQMYDRLQRAARKNGGPRPDRYTALDSQWVPGKTTKRSAGAPQGRPVAAVPEPARAAQADAPEGVPSAAESSTAPAEPSLGDRLADRIRTFVINGATETTEGPEYVAEDDFGYVHPIEGYDESPGPEWEPVTDEQFIINAQGLKTIEQNLGTYLSVVGITVEMIDPYCGPILAQNFDNIVQRWSKVIAHYPKAAELFMDGKGGVVFTWIGALQATWPVLYAIYQHHLAKTITVAPDGRIFHKNDRPNPENNGRFDPLQPEFQYSAT